MVGRANFSHKQLDYKSGNDIQEMLFQEKGINWGTLPTYEKRGACIVKESYTLDNELKTVRSRWVVDKDIPMFSADTKYIEKFVYPLLADYKILLVNDSGLLYCSNYEVLEGTGTMKFTLCTGVEVVLPVELIDNIVKQ